MKKIIKSRMFYFILGFIIAGSIGVYAAVNYTASQITYNKNGQATVEAALNDLYNKQNDDNYPYVEGIYTQHASSINYTYTAVENGMFVVGMGEVGSGNITTTGEIIYEKTEGVGHFKIIKLKTGETITITATNNSYTAGAFIARVNNLNIDELIDVKCSYDTTVTSEYTSTKNNEKLLVIAFPTGRDRSSSISFTGKFRSSYYRNNDLCIATVSLPKDAKVTVSSYGFMYSTTQTYIFKLK